MSTRSITVDLSGTLTRRGKWAAPTPTPPFVPDYPGQPAPATLLWGAAVGANDSPVSRHETPTGTALEVRRTFVSNWSNRNQCVTFATGDISAGRLPWVSTKVLTWSTMASGAADTDIDAFLESLDDCGGPVWLTLHHEPEDDVAGGGMAITDHVAMNAHVRDRMVALGTTNIALALILQSWTFDTRSGRNADDWWEADVYDFAGVDPYVCQDNGSGCQNQNIIDDLGGGNNPPQAVWFDMREWAADRSVDLNVGEWGIRGTDGDRIQNMYDECVVSYADGLGARVSALAYFDSGQESPGGTWELPDGDMLDTFHAVLVESAAAKEA